MATHEKVDLYRELKGDYTAKKKPVIVETTAGQYLCVDGEGAPGNERFTKAIGALYTVGFTAKMHSKFAGRDYAVCKLEGIWWTGRDNGDMTGAEPENWKWKLLIRIPDFVTQEFIEETIEKLLEKGKPEEVSWVGLERIEEGKCVQMLHVGHYDQEQETLEQMEAFAKEEGLKVYGKHHEIYLSDPRRVAPERLKTILRRRVRYLERCT